ncbi:MAG: hypothetical protein JWM05_555 [Acidimicrobiales bacterium]|nr:hypothetical protein [Acidimicrobiales bacterium]
MDHAGPRRATTRRACTATRTLALLLGVILVAAACAPSGNGPIARSFGVHLQDFQIRLEGPRVRAGSVDLRLTNKGPTVHELVVVRTDARADRLPLGPDGLSVSETSPVIHKVDEQQDVDLEAGSTLHVRLTPGRYVVFCNLEGHYLAGMHKALQVVP